MQGIDDEGFIEMQLKRPNQYQQDGVFFLTDETNWEKQILTPATGMAIAFDTAIKKLDVQRAIVNIYKCANEAKQIAEEADKLSRAVCPALLQHIIHS